MIWLLLGGLALLAMAPLAWAQFRPARLRGRAEADLALYHAQLAEIDREQQAGRLDATQHQAARLEIQRRILSAPADAKPEGRSGRSAAVMATLVFLLPAAALAIYMRGGTPDMPAAPFAERQALTQEEDRVLGMLRGRLAAMDPASDGARQGQMMLGNAERGRGRLAEAAAAYRAALEGRFNPQIAGNLVEIQIERGETEAADADIARFLAEAPGDPRLRFLAGLSAVRAGQIERGRTLWQALLTDSPADAPWRSVVQAQLEALPAP